MACLGKLRVETLLLAKEATHESCYPFGAFPPSRPASAATPPPPRTAFRSAPRPRRHSASAPRGEGLLPRPPLRAVRHPLGLPVPSPRPGSLLSCRRQPLPRLAGRPTAAALRHRHRRLLQGPPTPPGGRAVPTDPRHRPAGPRRGPADVDLGRP